MTTGKIIALTRHNFVSKVVSLLFNTLSRFVIAFLPRSKCLLISWLQSPSIMTLEPKKIKSNTVSIFFPFPIYLLWSDGTRCHDPSFLDAVLSQLFHSSLSPSSRGSLVLHFFTSKWYHLRIWGCWYFSWQSWFQLVGHPAQDLYFSSNLFPLLRGLLQ